jgi:hypothetical protein
LSDLRCIRVIHKEHQDKKTYNFHFFQWLKSKKHTVFYRKIATHRTWVKLTSFEVWIVQSGAWRDKSDK